MRYHKDDQSGQSVAQSLYTKGTSLRANSPRVKSPTHTQIKPNARQLTSILCWSDKSRRGDDDEGKEKEYTGHGDEVSRDNCQRF